VAAGAALVIVREQAHPRRMNTREARFLDGQLLIAMPGMGDLRFERSVIFMCAHSAEGAMGLIVNKPAPELSFADLLRQLKIPSGADLGREPVHFGGPVEHGRGFVLHSAEYSVEGASLRVNDAFAMTATIDILQDMARGEGPKRALLALGYAGWGPGQLEGEIQANGWLTAAADQELVFGVRDAEKWEAALRSLSIDPRLLSAEGGRA
jgi:putative transcriptional regulator